MVYRLMIPSKWTASTLIVKRTIRRLWYRRVLFDVPHNQSKTIDSSRFRDHSFVCMFQYRRARSFTRFMDRGAAPMDTRAIPHPSEPSYPSRKHPSFFLSWVSIAIVSWVSSILSGSVKRGRVGGGTGVVVYESKTRHKKRRRVQRSGNAHPRRETTSNSNVQLPQGFGSA